MVSAYSRMLFARLIPTHTAQDLYTGWYSTMARSSARLRTCYLIGGGSDGATWSAICHQSWSATLLYAPLVESNASGS